MIFVIDRAGLHGNELSGAKQRYAVTLRADDEFHGSRNYLLGMAQEFACHLVRECDQRRALLRGCLVIHEEDSPRRIWIRVGIAQGSVGMDGGGNRQAV